MKKIIILIIMCLMLIPISYGYSSWIRPIISNTDETFMRSDIESATFQSNCELAGGTSKYGALVDSHYYYIWTTGVSAVTVWDNGCNFIDEISYNGTIEGSSYLYNIDSDTYQDILIPIKTPDGTISIVDYELEGTTLTLLRTYDLGSGVTRCGGVWVDSNYNMLATFCNTGIIRLNLGTGAITTKSTHFFEEYNFYSNLGYWKVDSNTNYYNPYSDFDEGVSGADVDHDGKEEVLFYAINYTPSSAMYMGAIVYEIATNSIEAQKPNLQQFFTTSVTGATAQLDYIASPYVFGNLGNPNSDFEVFYLLTTRSNLGGSSYKAGVYNYLMSSSLNANQTFLNNNPGYWKVDISNWAVGDVDLDSNNEYCSIMTGQIAGSKFKLVCFDSDHTLLVRCNMTEIDGSVANGSSLFMFEYDDSNDYLEFATQKGVYEIVDGGECNKLYDVGLTGTTNWGSFIGADINGDNKLDLIYCDSTKCMVYKTYEAGASESISTSDCSPPCIYSFDNKYCYNSSNGGLHEKSYYVYPSNYYSEITESFNLDITGGESFVEHKLSYYDSTDLKSVNAYTIQWFVSGGNTYLQYHYNNSNEIISLCTNCWQQGVNHEYIITHWGADTNDRSFYNTSSNSTVSIIPNSFMITITGNGTQTFGNIPLNNPSNENKSRMLDTTYFSWYESYVCLDDYSLFVGEGSYDYSTTYTSNRQIGDYCTTNTQCLTGLCEYHSCTRKGLGATCEYGWECISRKCANGYCTKAEFQQSLEESIGQNFGYTKGTLNFVSLLILIILVVLIVIGTRGGMLGAVLGLTIFVIGSIMFTIIGWLNPFIMIAVMLMVIISIVFLLFVGRG